MPTLRLYRSFLALYVTVGIVVFIQSGHPSAPEAR